MTIPIYNADIADVTNGITCVSLVDAPAVESDFFQFAKQHLQLSVNGNKVMGVLLRADYPIYRTDAEGAYYIRFTRDVIWEIAKRFQQADKLESIQHNGQTIEGVKLVSLFVKDVERGINPAQFDEVSDGSLFAVYEIENKEVLHAIQQGVLRGFSIEGYFGMNKSKFNNNMKIKDFLKKFIDDTNVIKVDDNKTIIAADGGELVEGKEVAFLETDDQVPDGEYKAGGKVYVIKENKIAEIREETAEPEPDNGQQLADEQLKALEERIAAIEKVVFAEPQQQMQNARDMIKNILGH